MVALPNPPNPTVEAIYRAYETRQGNGFRRHLGASLIGNECERALWYTFRWTRKAQHAGRLLRLFESGNLAEARFIADLRAIGCTVLEVDPGTGKQWTVSAVNSHFGGSMDSVIIGLPEAPKTYHLGEYKTHSAKSFAALQKDGVEKSKPLHAAQMQTYMALSGLDRAVYLAVCKDTDELYAERIHADPAIGAQLLAKAERVINSPHLPPRAYNSESFFMCKFCDFREICWQGAPVERNCRTCLSSTPVEDGNWHCARHDGVIDRRFEAEGCSQHLTHPELVNGAVLDAGDDFVRYRMADGSEFVEGVP